MQQIVCISTNIGLTDEISEYIIELAEEMIAEKEHKRLFSEPSLPIEGELITSYTLACLGQFAGFVFKVNMDSERGRIRAEYIVKPITDFNSKNGSWEHRDHAVDADPILN